MAISIKFTKFDNTPWGFRLAGGSDFPQPLTVIRVTEGSLAECMGLKVGDVVVRLNDQPIGSLTHGQAHEELMRAGNNFALGIQREGDPHKALEGLSDDNIVPYKIPLAELPPVFPEQILKEETVIEQYEETTYEETTTEEAKPEVEPLPDKPKDENSEIVPNQNLTDDEIAQLILEEEELLDEKGVLGVNFKKLRPRATVLRQSKVIEELQNIATAEPPLVEQLKRTSVFLQKPQRPIPQPRKKEEDPVEEVEVESYRVVITKQKKRSVTDRLLEKGLLKPEERKTPEPRTPEVIMAGCETVALIEQTIVPASSLEDESCSACPLEQLEQFSSKSFSSASPELVESVEPEALVVLCSEVAPAQPSRRRENVTITRRPSSKRKPKGFYTRGHYFRRCLFGKKSLSEPRRPSRVRSSLKDYPPRDVAEDVSGGFEQLEDSSRRGSIERSARYRVKGRYLETYLKREDNWMRRMVDGLIEKPDSFSSSKLFDRLVAGKEVSWRRTRYAEKILARSVAFVAIRLRSDVLAYLERGGSVDALNPSFGRIRKRFYLKGRYFQRIFWRNVVRLINYLKGVSSTRDLPRRDRRRSSAMIRMKGRYVEKCLFARAATRPPSVAVSSKRKLLARARYAERILKKHFESLGLIVGYLRAQILRASSDSSLASQHSRDDRDSFSELVRSSKDFISTEVFHRGSRRLSRSSCRNSVSEPSAFALLRDFVLDRLPNKLTGRTVESAAIAEKKATSLDVDRDGRRLSFVPTILYEGLTNRIGVDFTRLVAYAFVPCTSIILLYMYK
ncbi:uncharacterized protein LOC143210028 isoform X1 [Lasioglossum baleicum]|uniref:uncharacterized protein LOC143210028 isoform X1 n=1 Tax=Lasioglossum baleicum TaxID=434251 RepID=UPI003FCC5576